MKAISKKKNVISIINIYIVLYIFAVNFLFVPSSDDIIFREWRFASLKDYLLVNPMQGNFVQIPHNGRYIGNLIGIILSTLCNMNLEYVKHIFMAAGVILLIVLLNKYNKIKAYSPSENFLIVAFLVISLPLGVYREVLSWGAGYSNYFIPILGLLLIFIFLKDNEIKKAYYPLFFIAFLATQLFVETITIYCVMFSLVLIYGVLQKKNEFSNQKAIIVIVSTIIGAIIMFTNKGYTVVGQDNYREISTSTIFSNMIIIFRDDIIYSIFIIPAISYLLVKIAKNKKNNLINNIIGKLLIGLNISLIILCIISIRQENYDGSYQCSIYIMIPAIAIMTIFIYIMIKYIDKGKQKSKILFWYFSAAFSASLMLMITPIGPRASFICYIFQMLILMELMNYCTDKGITVKLNFNCISCVAVIISLVMFTMYASNYYIIKQREIYIQNKLDKLETSITIPTVYFYQCRQLDIISCTTEIEYLCNKEVEITFVPYKDWLKIKNN